MRNIKMTMSRIQLNSKFDNNMLPEWDRIVTGVKLNRGLKDSNYDQLYAYLKQYEAHANENKMLLDRFTQHTVDPLALMSNDSLQRSLNPRNQATIQDGRVVIQNVQGQQNKGQRNNARGAGAASYGGDQNRVGDGASWSTVVEEGESVDSASSRATTSAIRAMTLGARESTLGGGVSNLSNSG
nr:integrase, catalytic region, zinc finger, CCHC-type, peptidase aspartic, catalytic [Tanacetum cinerariifolium]